MAITTDDQDIRDVKFFMNHGGNGDYYFNLLEYNKEGRFTKAIDFRFAMSGGNAPTEVKLAVVALYRAMEAAKLNNHPKNE